MFQTEAGGQRPASHQDSGEWGLPHWGRWRAGLLLLSAALAGAALMAAEILSAGWLAPDFGAGIDVWAAVLGVTLGAMTLGYFLGSVSARVAGGPRALACLLALAGAAVLLGASAGRLRSWPAPTGTSSAALLTGAAMLLVPPVALLAVVSTWMVEVLASRSAAGAGRCSGAVYAASTLGGVAGALAAGLWAAPGLGLWNSSLAAAALLAPAALVYAGVSRRGQWVPLVAALALAAVLAAAWALGRSGPADPARPAGARRIVARDGWYGRVEVFQDESRRWLSVNGIPQTVAPLPVTGSAPDPAALLRSGNSLGLLPFLRPAARRALVVGLGGGLVSRSLAAAGMEVESVELDPFVERLARSQFGFAGHCRVGDGRRFLAGRCGPYDVAVLDVYRGEHLPAHLCTLEFFDLLRSRLSPGGVAAVNLIGSAGGADTRALVRTVGTAFPETLLLAPGGGRQAGPMTLLASTAPLLDPSTADRLRERGLDMPERVSLAAPGTGELLTDAMNPMPLLRRETAAAWRAAARRQLAGPALPQ